MYILIICLVFFFIFLTVLRNTGRVDVITPDDDEELIEIPNEEAYEEETKERIISLKKLIDKDGIDDNHTKAIKKLNEEINSGYKNWEALYKELNEMIAVRTDFITQSNFYPREYVYDINRMRNHLENTRNFQLENPLKDTSEIEKFIEDQNSKIKEYIKIKDSLETLLPKMDEYEKGLTAKKQLVDYYNKKQELYLKLQNGELSETREILNYFRKKLKNYQK